MCRWSAPSNRGRQPFSYDKHSQTSVKVWLIMAQGNAAAAHPAFSLPLLNLCVQDWIYPSGYAGSQSAALHLIKNPTDAYAVGASISKQAGLLPLVGGLNGMLAVGMAGATSSRIALCLAVLLIAQCALCVSARTPPAGRALQQVSAITQPLVGGSPAQLAQMSVMGMSVE